MVVSVNGNHWPWSTRRRQRCQRLSGRMWLSPNRSVDLDLASSQLVVTAFNYYNRIKWKQILSTIPCLSECIFNNKFHPRSKERLLVVGYITTYSDNSNNNNKTLAHNHSIPSGYSSNNNNRPLLERIIRPHLPGNFRLTALYHATGSGASSWLLKSSNKVVSPASSFSSSSSYFIKHSRNIKQTKYVLSVASIHLFSSCLIAAFLFSFYIVQLTDCRSYYHLKWLFFSSCPTANDGPKRVVNNFLLQCLYDDCITKKKCNALCSFIPLQLMIIISDKVNKIFKEKSH